MIILIGIISVVLLALYVMDLKKNRLNTKQLVVIAMMAGLSFILSMFKLIQYPQDGGITLFSMLPIMLIGLLYGRTAGVTCGLVAGLLSLLNGAYVVHPVQFLLDYVFGSMALGLAGVFGNDKKYKIFLGCLFASGLCVLAYFTSGVVFFGQFAPEGIGAVLYSFIYNFSSAGVEGVITSFVILLLPLKKFKEQISRTSKAA